MFLNQKGSRIGWFKLSFISWLAIQDKLSTKRRQKKWTRNIDPLCVFCQQEVEDWDHLLFTCSYTKKIQQEVLQSSNLQGQLIGWSYEVEWALKFLQKRTFPSVLLRLAMALFCILCLVRKEPEKASDEDFTVIQIVQQITTAVKFWLQNTPLCLKANRSGKFQSVCHNWGPYFILVSVSC